MTTVSVDQRFALLSTLGGKTQWDELTGEQVQGGISAPNQELARVGSEFTQFIRNGFQAQVVNLFHETGELSIPILRLPRPTLEELRVKFPGIKEKNGIERDDSPVESVTLKLGSVLIPGEEKSVKGKKYECRLLVPRNQGILLGYQHAVWLVEHQDEFPALKPFLGKVYIDFPGLIVVRGGGDRYVFCLDDDGKRWCVYWYCLSDGVDLRGRTAFSGK